MNKNNKFDEIYTYEILTHEICGKNQKFYETR